MNDRPEFEMPDSPEEEVCVEYRDFVVFTAVYHDETPPNPCEDWDGMGTMYSFSRRHINFLNVRDEDDLEERFGQDYVLLGYFEHGICIWHISHETPLGTEGDYRWDGVRYAGVWVPDQVILDEMEGMEQEDRTAHMRKRARETCEVYTDWCNGNVYGYVIAVYQSRLPYDQLHDYRHSAAEFEDSCWGYYGWDHLRQDVKRVFELALDKIDEWAREMEEEDAVVSSTE